MADTTTRSEAATPISLILVSRHLACSAVVFERPGSTASVHENRTSRVLSRFRCVLIRCPWYPAGDPLPVIVAPQWHGTTLSC